MKNISTLTLLTMATPVFAVTTLSSCAAPPPVAKSSATTESPIKLVTTSANTTTKPAPAQPALYGAWRASKIGGGGYLQNVVFTSDPQVLYAYADVAGPWRSDNGGASWRALYGNLPSRSSYGVRALTVDPANPDKVLIASGTQWSPADGAYLSADGGKTWKKTLTAHFYANEDGRSTGLIVARDPKTPSTILLASGDDGVFRSTDGGATWKKSELPDIYATDLKIDSQNGRRVLLCAKTQKMWRDDKYIELKGGFFGSNDGGTTWQKIADVAPAEIVQEQKNPTRWYGLFDGKSVRLSTDNGATWSELSDGLDSRDANWMDELNALASGPVFVLTATMRGVFYRLDAGQTRWRKIERKSVEEQYEGREWFGTMAHNKSGDWQHFGAALGSIIVDPRDPQHWFFTDWYATYQTRDAGKNWKLSMNGIELTVIHALTQDPSDAAVVHLGMADNGYLMSQDGGDRFTTPKVNSTMKAIAVSPKLPNRVYGVGNRTPGAWESNQVFVSIDRGRTWTVSPMIGMPDMAKSRSNSIAVSPTDPYTVFVAVSGEVRTGEGGVYKSVDGGKKWTWIGAGLPSGEKVFRDDVWVIGREIAVAPNGALAAISRDLRQVYCYDAKTAQWTKANLAFTSKVMSVVADMSTDAKAPARFFVGVENEGVYRSVDSGKTWNRVLDKGVYHVAVDAAQPQRVAAGTSDGVQLSLDGGNTWSNVGQKLPYRYYPIVAFAGNRLFAGTSGSGVYWMPLNTSAATATKARAVKVATVPNASVGSNQFVLPNGDMEEGASTPNGWKIGWTGAGKLNLVRDTTMFKTGKAALRLESSGGAAQGSAALDLPRSVEPFQLSGFLKSDGQIEEATLAVQSFDSNYKQTGWMTLTDALNAKDWTAFSKSVQLPQDAAHNVLTLTFKGQGHIWLDELKAENSSTKNIFLP